MLRIENNNKLLLLERIDFALKQVGKAFVLYTYLLGLRYWTFILLFGVCCSSELLGGHYILARTLTFKEKNAKDKVHFSFLNSWTLSC